MNSSTNIKRKKNQSDILIFFLFIFLTMLCVGILGFVTYQMGYFDNILFSASTTRTAIADNNATCQRLIQKAMEVSADYCNGIDSNKACYGNNTLKADLVPGSTEQFIERGDVVGVEELQRIVASPLKPDSDEWGIAVLKVLANLPRSLPGQTITMVVFGNTTLDNAGGNLDSFFFSSELGQIQCDKVPQDGVMITVPDGEGITFMVNGAELTLMGDASITAQKNGKMVINLYEGVARIVSDGAEEIFEAGQQVSVPLGGANGTDSVGVPSEPGTMSQEDLDTVCLLTGQYCQQDQITPVSSAQAEVILGDALGFTPVATPVGSQTVTRPPAATFTTSTQLIIVSRTPTFNGVFTNTRLPAAVVTNTFTRTVTKTVTPSRTRTRTLTPTRTPTRTSTSTSTSTSTRTPTITPGGPTLTPSQTFTVTLTHTPTLTSTGTSTLVDTATPTSTATETQTFTPTNTATITVPNTPMAACIPITTGIVTVSGPPGKTLLITITNGMSLTITLVSVSITNNETLKNITANGNTIWTGTDSNPVKNISTWSGSSVDREIAASGGTLDMEFEFQNPIGTAANTSFDFNFDNGCTVSAVYP